MSNCAWCGKEGANIVLSKEIAPNEVVCKNEECKVEFANSRGIQLDKLGKRLKSINANVKVEDSTDEPNVEDVAKND